MQPLAALLIIPGDPRIPGTQVERTCRKPDRPQDAVGTHKQVSQLCARKGRGTLRMLLIHQRVPYRAIVPVCHPFHGEILDLTYRARHLDGCGNRRVQQTGSSGMQ